MCSYVRRASSRPDEWRKEPGFARDSRATRPACHVPRCSEKEACCWKASSRCHLTSPIVPLAVVCRKKLGLSAASRDTTSGSAEPQELVRSVCRENRFGGTALQHVCSHTQWLGVAGSWGLAGPCSPVASPSHSRATLWPASLWMEMGGYRRPQLLLSSAPSLLLFRQKALPVLVPAMLGTKQIGMIILQGTVRWAWETSGSESSAFSCCVTGSISSCRRNPLSQEALSGPDGQTPHLTPEGPKLPTRQTPYLTLKLSLSC